MPTDNQELDQQSLSILYGENLYSIDSAHNKPLSVPVKEQKPADLPNKEQTPLAVSPIVIVLRDKLREGDSTHEMFIKLLEACKLSVEKIKIISPFTFDLTASSLLHQYAPTHILMFGVGSSEIGLSVYFPDYQVQTVDGVTYLTAPDLSLIENNKDIKAKLWQSLKKAFSL